MVQELVLPLPSFRWRTGQTSTNLMKLFNCYGTTLSPHVSVYFGRQPKFSVVHVLQALIVLLYVTSQLYVTKSYLRLAATEGTSRLQLQHPVQHCNPLNPKCKSNFASYDELPYCKQHEGKVDKNEVAQQEECEYFDEFDIKLPGYQATNMLIPTRRTVYDLKVMCRGRTGACENKYEIVGTPDTVFVADIDSFTLLIDHSMVCPNLGLSKQAWDMVGFYEICPVMEGEDVLKTKTQVPGAGCKLKPIHRLPQAHETEADENFLENEKASMAMWMQPNALYTFFPFLPDSMTSKVQATTSPFTKLKSGDVISIRDLLKEVGVDLDKARGDHSESGRFNGIVVVIDIEYSNYKYFTWPNRLPPCYKYRVKLSPAGEYKVMDIKGQAHGSKRHVMNVHGIYIIVNHRGHLGVWSGMYTFGMLLGGFAMLSISRYCVAMYVLNFVKLDRDSDYLERTLDDDVVMETKDGVTTARSNFGFTPLSQGTRSLMPDDS